ncbi:MAG: kinase [Woeseiaceae bacterium]
MTNTDVLDKEMLSEFITEHRLPAEFADTATRFFLYFALQLPEFRSGDIPLFLGINGAQGTGKSTLASFIKIATSALLEWNVAVLSIDDFYYTLAERIALADAVHPLLRTRGVPGTHDTKLLAETIVQLMQAGPGDEIPLPRFDKATDDRKRSSDWPVVSGPLDLVILEGWCVGSRAQSSQELDHPINEFERQHDVDGRWRRLVNEKLSTDYAPVFRQLDVLAFLRVPDFDCIHRWRQEQEDKLAASADAGSKGLMSEAEVRAFIQHFERLTQANLDTLQEVADVVFELNTEHAVVAVTSTATPDPQH